MSPPPRPLPHPLRLALGLLVTLLVLGGLELGLRLILGPPEPPILVAARLRDASAPFETRGSRVLAAYQGRDAIPPFSPRPAAGLPRVMVFGGSAVHGGSRLDHTREFADLVGAWLAERGVQAELLNLGQTGMDSHTIRTTAELALAYQPDLLVLYLGHNDLGNTIMEARYPGYGGALEARTMVALRRMKLYELLRAGVTSDVVYARAKAEAWDMPPLSPAQRVVAAGYLEQNLAHIARQARRVGAEVLMVTPISEMTRQPRSGTTRAEQRELMRIPPPEDRERGLAPLDTAIETEPERADLLWARGTRRLRAGLPGAHEDLRRASDLDPRPLHASEAMVDAMRTAARDSDSRLLDLRAQVFEAHGIPPAAWFMDEVHFTEEGHRAVAEILAPAVAEALEGR